MEYSFLVSYILVLIPIIYSYKQGIGIEKEMLINSFRALIQLFLLGFVLVYVFKIENLLLLILILILMSLYSARIAQKRVKEKFIVGFLAISLSSFLVLFSLIALNIISTNPNQFIPIGGMIIGNALNIYTLSIERFKREIENNKELIESYSAIGTSYNEAVNFAQKQSIKASLIPVNNMLQTVGVVAIPGITTGMLLAGAEPMTAISYQLVIMYMIVSVNLFSAIFSILFLLKFR
jgi:putative ABC transport system permease protein